MTRHRITMIFEDGRSEEIEADEADTVYMAALRNKIRLMTDCLEVRARLAKVMWFQGNTRWMITQMRQFPMRKCDRERFSLVKRMRNQTVL